MAKKSNDLRPTVKLRSTAGTGYTWGATALQWGEA
jgi:hypothetical protein